MDFDTIVRNVQADDPTRTAADIQADLEWLVEHGYLHREPIVTEAELLMMPAAGGLH
jgi:hypothetical protein